jgi:hypothetical protein
VKRTLRIYVASSWRNVVQQPRVVAELRAAGYDVYDFRHPAPDDDGFRWSDIDPDWKSWTPEAFREGLEHPIARRGYGLDYDAMLWADVCVLVMPCGRSAHLEAGWFAGRGNKRLVILLSDGEPELMYRMADGVCVDMDDVLTSLGEMDAATLEDGRLENYRHELAESERITAAFRADIREVVESAAGAAKRKDRYHGCPALGRLQRFLDDVPVQDIWPEAGE